MAKVWDVIGKQFLDDDDHIIVARQAAKDKRDREYAAARDAFHIAVRNVNLSLWKQDDDELENIPRSSMFRGKAQEILQLRRQSDYKRVNNLDIDVKGE